MRKKKRVADFAPVLHVSRLEKEPARALAECIPQIYRLCFLLTGEAHQALEAFQNTMREATQLAARSQLPNDRLWLFHEARHHCLALTAGELQAENSALAEEAIAPHAAARVAQLEPEQFATWIATAPEPQRSALAFFYLNEFSHREMQNLLDLKMEELAALISHGRTQFQAWLNTVTTEPRTA